MNVLLNNITHKNYSQREKSFSMKKVTTTTGLTQTHLCSFYKHIYLLVETSFLNEDISW